MKLLAPAGELVCVDLAASDHGRPDKGTVIVMLDMDGEGFDVVVIEEYLDSLPQLDKAIEALTKARN
jgi:hypothetical protein